MAARASTLRAGVLDLNAEFDTPVTSALFVGPPHGIGTELSQTGRNGPAIWPVTGLGVRAAGALRDGLVWRAAIYEGMPGAVDDTRFASFRVGRGEGVLAIAELAYSTARINKLSLGTWSYTAAFERVDASSSGAARPQRGNRGTYASLDVPLTTLGSAKVDGAVRVGIADARFNTFDEDAGASFAITHPFARRADDALGLAIAYARAGEPYRAAQSFAGRQTTAAETSFELAYRVAVADWLSLMPGVQFVRNPGADRAFGNAWVVGMRFEIATETSWPLAVQRAAPAAPSLALSHY